MTTLFTISRSWHNNHWLFEKIAFASPGDAILLIEDAVVGLQASLTLASFIAKCSAAKIGVYALKEDVLLRGVDNAYPEIQLIDYVGFVELTIQHGKQVAW